MYSKPRTRARRLALACACALVGAGGLPAGPGVARAATTPTAGEQEAPVYTFLIRSGLSKRAKAQSAIFRGVMTVERAGRKVVTSTVTAVHKPEILAALQLAIFGGTVVQEVPESTKAGTLEITYDDGTTIPVVIYQAYYEITASSGTIRFTSVPLTQILHDLVTQPRGTTT